MPNDELFSGIPSLGDEAGMQDYMNNSVLANAGLGNDTTPAALQQVQTPAEPAPQAQPTTAPTTENPSYTAEHIQQILARNQQLEAYAAQQAQMQRAQQAQVGQQAYTPQQAAIIKQLIDRGVSLDRINEALNKGRAQNQAQNAMMQRLAAVERHLQQQEYTAAQDAFVDRMTAFGEKFGLSENDLVTFGNKAMTMGINLTTVPGDSIEAVFRAVYPDQYAIRSQRIAGTAASQIYGGSSAVETPRAASSKLEDAYVDAFLRQSMPNQYGMYTK